MAAVQYTVHRVNWRRYGEGLVRLAGTTRVASFPTQAAADEECRRLEAEARNALNPFQCGLAWHERTSLDPERLHDWALDIGLTPPTAAEGEPPDWAGWWREHFGAMSDLQRDRLWQGLDRLRFYEVVESPVRRVVDVVVRISWQYTDDSFVAEPEGGLPHHVFRTRKEAEAFCRKAGPAYFSDEPMYMGERRRCQQDPLGLRGPWPADIDGAAVEDAPLYDILEVEVES